SKSRSGTSRNNSMNHDYSPFPLTTGTDNLSKFMVRVLGYEKKIGSKFLFLAFQSVGHTINIGSDSETNWLTTKTLFNDQ
ncbi:MAG: hypothetical protein ACTSV5_00645, partial [Promethearchaeota archaeon]